MIFADLLPIKAKAFNLLVSDLKKAGFTVNYVRSRLLIGFHNDPRPLINHLKTIKEIIPLFMLYEGNFYPIHTEIMDKEEFVLLLESTFQGPARVIQNTLTNLVR